MKIKEIRLTNFRNHQKTIVAGLDKVNYFLGANGAGKSTLLDAIQYALTGTARGTTDGGMGADCLKSEIPGGPRAAAAVTLLTDKGEVMRGVGQGPKSQAHFNIQTMLGLDPQFLRIMAAPMNLLRLEKKKQEQVFFSLTGGAVSKAEIEKALIEAGVTDASEVADQTLTPAAREYYLGHLKQRRPEIKREIAGLVYVPPEGVVKVDETRRRRLEVEHKKLADQIAQAESGGRVAEANRRSLEEQRQAVERKIADLENAKEVDERLTDEKLEEFKRLLANHEELHSEYQSLMTRRNSAMQRMGEFRNRGEKIKSLGPKCSSCEQSLAASYTESILKELRESYNAAKAESDKTNADMDAVQQKINAIDTGKIRDLLSRHERSLGRAQAVQQQLESLKTELQTLMLKIDALPSSAQSPVDFWKDKLAELASQITLLGDAEKEGGRALYINQSRQRKEDELAEVERIIEAIGPGGPVAQMMTSGGVEEVVTMVRECAERLGVGDVGINFDPWQITLNGRNIELASGSEEWRVAASFGFAFAKRAKASIVCLDGADILRGDNRDRLTDVIAYCGLEQVFVAGAVDQDPPEALELEEGRAVFHVKADERGVAQVRRVATLVTP